MRSRPAESTTPKGSYIIRMQQPYSAATRKRCWSGSIIPTFGCIRGGPPQRPYDVTAHTLPLLMGVETDTIDAPFAVASSLTKSFEFERTCRSPGPTLHRFLARSQQILTATPVFELQLAFPRAAPQDENSRAYRTLQKLCARHRRRLDSLAARRLPLPLYQPAEPRIDTGNLRQRFDVIVFPDQPASQIANGYEPGTMPQEYTGGLSTKAAANLKNFAEQGGTLVFLNRSANYAVDHLHLDVKNVVAGVPDRDFYSPGSLLNATLDTRNALAKGLPENIAIWSEESPAWEVPAGSKDNIVIRYPDDHVLASGWLLGESYIKGRAALVDVPIGQGRAVLFGFRPQYRAQSYQAFKLFFNSLVFNAVPAY